MLNKELLLSLTPTNEEGIFLLTVGRNSAGSFYGYDKGVRFGDLVPKSSHEVKGTNGETFSSDILRLRESTKNVVYITFYSAHLPGSADTNVYLHIKYPNGRIFTGSFYFPLNRDTAVFTATEDVFIGLEDSTLRIYLGPSPTPPHTSRRYLRRDSLC